MSKLAVGRVQPASWLSRVYLWSLLSRGCVRAMLAWSVAVDVVALWCGRARKLA